MKNKNFNFAQNARRQNELQQYGKIISLRPSISHKSKKSYDRKNNKKEISKQLEISYFFFNIYIPHLIC